MKCNPLFTVVATGALLATGALAHSATYSATPADESGTQQSDVQITVNVKDKLQADEPAIAPGIVVTTRDGVVTLKGIGLTQDYIIRALFDARNVDGVVQVKNELSLN